MCRRNASLYKHVRHVSLGLAGLVMGVRFWRGVELWLVLLDNSDGRAFVEYPADDWILA